MVTDVESHGSRIQTMVPEFSVMYGDVSTLLSNTESNKNNIYRPIVYNLRALPGAIYWIKQPDARGHSNADVFTAAWDLNYFSFEFGPYTQDCLGNTTTDALPIKLVRKK